jgi:hypothetical protein
MRVREEEWLNTAALQDKSSRFYSLSCIVTIVVNVQKQIIIIICRG